jgi:dihydroorotase
MSGIETCLGVVLSAVEAGRLTLYRAVEALTTGPAHVLPGRLRRGQPGLTEGVPADLVVFDRAGSWTVTAEALRSKGKNTPLLGRELPGLVLLTVANGRIAYEAQDA